MVLFTSASLYRLIRSGFSTAHMTGTTPLPPQYLPPSPLIDCIVYRNDWRDRISRRCGLCAMFADKSGVELGLGGVDPVA